jgi:hypothetical protein
MISRIFRLEAVYLAQLARCDQFIHMLARSIKRREQRAYYE